MLKKYTYLFFCIAIFGMNAPLSAQTAEGCDGNRYFLDVFDNTTKTTVKFGENTTARGDLQELFMDIYMPEGDVQTKRPLIVWAFGGAFVTGERESMEQNCIDFAKKGYVAATIDYRLWSIFTQGIPDSLQMLENAVRALSDMKAAIRHFRMDAATDNLYRIDTDFIFVGGVSAGAITALNAAHLDEDDTIPAYLQTIVDNHGGLEGNSGNADNLTYSSEVHGALNLSGALHRKDWLDAGDPPFISLHGDADLTVPYGHGNAIVLGFRFMSLDGSGALKEQADAVGVDNYLKTVVGGGHESTYTDPAFAADRAEFYLNGHNFFHNVLCDSYILDTESPELQQKLVGIFPNPASERITLDVGEISGAYNVRVYDPIGRLVANYNNVRDRQLALESAAIGKGMFLVTVDFSEQNFAPVTRKIMFH